MDTREELKKSEYLPQAGEKHGLFAGGVLISGQKLKHQLPPTEEKVSVPKLFVPGAGQPGVKGDDRCTLGDPDDSRTLRLG